MSDATQGRIREKRAGDTAVDGLFAGILAGLGMAAYLVLSGLLSGTAPKTILGRFDPRMDGNWSSGMLAHLAVSAVYGVIFALLFSVLVRWRPAALRFGWLVGLIYGLLLAALARGVLLPLAGSPLLQTAFTHLVIAHAIYGLALGFEVGRRG